MIFTVYNESRRRSLFFPSTFWEEIFFQVSEEFSFLSYKMIKGRGSLLYLFLLFCYIIEGRGDLYKVDYITLS